MMTRPPSILTFERSYLTALLLGIANTLLHWDYYRATPQVERANVLFGNWFAPAVTIAGASVSILLLYFIARRGSVVAKWLVSVSAVLFALLMVFNLVAGSFASPTSAILAIAVTVLNLFAASRLFRADTKPWFGEDLQETTE